MPDQSAQESLHSTLDENIRLMAEMWASGQVLGAQAMARACKARYDVLWYDDAKARFGDGWPLPGVPEADEATGWSGWYGEDYREVVG